MIDITALRQAYNRGDIPAIGRLRSGENAANAFTKQSPRYSSDSFLKSASLNMYVGQWVVRPLPPDADRIDAHWIHIGKSIIQAPPPRISSSPPSPPSSPLYSSSPSAPRTTTHTSSHHIHTASNNDAPRTFPQSCMTFATAPLTESNLLHLHHMTVRLLERVSIVGRHPPVQ